MPRSKHSFERDSPWGCPISNKFALRSVVEFIETTTFSVAVISTSSMSATLITFGTASSLSRPAPYLCKNQLEDSSYKGLNKKQLGKESKRKIKAHEAQPLNKSDMNLKSIVVRIIKKSCNQAHCRNLGSDGCKPAKCSSGAF